MKVLEFCEALDKHLAAEADVNKRLLLLNNALQQAFKVKEDEFAILHLDSDGQGLTFLWPKKLARSGQIPINARDSLVARTAREGRPQLDNQFTTTRHASIFEKIPLNEAKSKEERVPAAPIQKIMSTPIQRAGQLLGVMQLSRKGSDADSAGPDFTPAELEAFSTIANAVAGHVPW